MNIFLQRKLNNFQHGGEMKEQKVKSRKDIKLKVVVINPLTEEEKNKKIKEIERVVELIYG